MTSARNLLLSALLLMPCLASAAEPASQIKEGEWETTATVKMENIPFAPPPMTSKACITKKDLAPRAQGGQDCTTKNQKVTGNVVEWTTECKDKKGNVTTGTGKVTYTGDTYAGEITTVIGAGPQAIRSVTTMSGKYLGPCKDAK